MVENALGSANRSDGAAANDRLDSWKEIAAYLKRDVTTVRRWEKREGLPVHRHLHERRDSVYAYTAEIDDWLQSRRNHFADAGSLDDETPGVEDVPSTPLVDPRARLPWAVAAVLFASTTILTVILVIFYLRSSPIEEAKLRYSISPPEHTSFGTVSLSPDGGQLAFTAAAPEGKALLWIRPLDALAGRSLRDTDDAAFPFWSPDSHALGFFAGGKLWTIAVSGGSPRFVCDAPNGRGGTWNRDGFIVFAPGREGALFRVAASGGPPTAVTTVERPGERGHLWPEFLPDGNHFLYLTDGTTPEHHSLFVGALDTTKRKALFRLASNAEYAQGGYLFFARAHQLVAQPFDANRLVLTGEPITLADQVYQQPQLDHKTDFSVSANGVLAYRRIQSPKTQLVWRDRTGQQLPLTAASAEYQEPTLSPDEKRVAIDVFDPGPSQRFGFGDGRVRSDIWILDRSTGAVSQFTSHPGADFGPIWAPDGRSIVFSSNRRDSLDVDMYQRKADGVGEDELLLASNGRKPLPQAWSPDGKYLVYGTFEPKTRGDLWLLPMVGDRIPRPLLRTEFNEEQAQISPDGRWFVYTSQESGRDEVYVQNFPAPAGKWRISTNGGGDARWAADGKELFYIGEDRVLMAVGVKPGPTFEYGAAVALFDTGMQPHWYESRNHYDVTRDGRFLFMLPIDDDRSSPFTLVVNWATRTR